jgi:hypothetical protein
VIWGYIGAETLQTFEKSAAWILATATCSGSMASVALTAVWRLTVG